MAGPRGCGRLPTAALVGLYQHQEPGLQRAVSRPVKVDAAGASVLLHRQDARIYALASTCSHLGGPLDEGKTSDGCITCPWHGSVFRLDDGRIVRGPASTPQPTYETRVANGRIEVRAKS